MNQREPVQASKGAGRAFRCLTLLLGSTLLAGSALAGFRIKIQVIPAEPVPECSQPYLPSLGPPSLRFSDPLPPPGAAVSSAAAPLLPLPSPTETSVAVANAAATAAAPSAKPAPARAPTAEVVADEPPAPSSASISILPDTVRPQVQAEDFLPYFVIPDGVKPSSTPPVPSEPGQLPPSTATYTQTPR